MCAASGPLTPCSPAFECHYPAHPLIIFLLPLAWSSWVAQRKTTWRASGQRALLHPLTARLPHGVQAMWGAAVSDPAACLPLCPLPRWQARWHEAAALHLPAAIAHQHISALHVLHSPCLLRTPTMSSPDRPDLIGTALKICWAGMAPTSPIAWAAGSPTWAAGSPSWERRLRRISQPWLRWATAFSGWQRRPRHISPPWLRWALALREWARRRRESARRRGCSQTQSVLPFRPSAAAALRSPPAAMRPNPAGTRCALPHCL